MHLPHLLPRDAPTGTAVRQGRPGGHELDRYDLVHTESGRVVGCAVQVWATRSRPAVDVAVAMQLGDLDNATPTTRVRVWHAVDLTAGLRSGRRVGRDARDAASALALLTSHPPVRALLDELDAGPTE